MIDGGHLQPQMGDDKKHWFEEGLVSEDKV